MSDTVKRTYRLVTGVLSVDVIEENLVLNVKRGKYFGIKGAMQHQLEGLRDGLSFDQMIRDTCSRYAVSPEDAASDLSQMLEKLIAAGIVEEVADAQSPPDPSAPISRNDAATG